ncbi:MAG: hypothetical protein ACLP5V_16450 [Candidatus Bathyarchaeia archaeon]
MKKNKFTCSICGKEIKTENLLARSASYPVSDIIGWGLTPQGVNNKMGIIRTCSIDCAQRLDRIQMEKSFGGVTIHRSRSDRFGRTEIVS